MSNHRKKKDQTDRDNTQNNIQANIKHFTHYKSTTTFLHQNISIQHW